MQVVPADIKLDQVVLDPTATPSLDDIRRLQALLTAAPTNLSVDELTRHDFCDGLYARTLFIPKGAGVVGKMHACQNLFFLVHGEMTIWTEKGAKRVKSPCLFVTQPGDKRVGYAHEDSLTVNVHPNPDNCRDLAVLEGRYIVDEAGELEKLS